MTCREFHRIVARMNPRDVTRSEDERIVAHGNQCAKCGQWLEQQKAIAAGIRALQWRTAGAEASPTAEVAVLRAFRQHVPATAANKEQGWMATLAARLSSWFEVGAYAAATAATLVALAAGIWYWQHNTHPAGQAQVAAQAQSSAQTPATATQGPDSNPAVEQSQPAQQVAVAAMKPKLAVVRSTKTATQQDATQTAQNQGYVALMLCDPLICSGDEEVVRMELPANSVNALSTSSQPLMADVVIGDDGLVRAVRIEQ